MALASAGASLLWLHLGRRMLRIRATAAASPPREVVDLVASYLQSARGLGQPGASAHVLPRTCSKWGEAVGSAHRSRLFTFSMAWLPAADDEVPMLLPILMPISSAPSAAPPSTNTSSIARTYNYVPPATDIANLADVATDAAESDYFTVDPAASSSSTVSGAAASDTDSTAASSSSAERRRRWGKCKKT